MKTETNRHVVLIRGPGRPKLTQEQRAISKERRKKYQRDYYEGKKLKQEHESDSTDY